MATAIHHARSSVRYWGGEPEDYLAIHEFFDSSKAHLPDHRHRALYHHTLGIELAERLFGREITTSAGRMVPVKWIGEQHMKEDFGFVPTPQQWLIQIQGQPWMGANARRLEKELWSPPTTTTSTKSAP